MITRKDEIRAGVRKILTSHGVVVPCNIVECVTDILASTTKPPNITVRLCSKCGEDVTDEAGHVCKEAVRIPAGRGVFPTDDAPCVPEQVVNWADCGRTTVDCGITTADLRECLESAKKRAVEKFADARRFARLAGRAFPDTPDAVERFRKQVDREIEEDG